MSTLNIGLMKCGSVIWQEAEETRKDFNIVLIHQDKKFFISELFKVIQDAIPFKFYQTRSNAIILYDTLPAYCIPKAIMMETRAIFYEKVYASPRPPPKISFKDNWMKELGSEVAGGSEDSQQTQPKTKNAIVRTGRLVRVSNHSVRVLRKSTNMSCLTAKAPT